MSGQAAEKAAPTPTSAPEPIQVTVTPVQGAEAGVYEVTVKVDDRQPGSSVVRTLPKRFAFQAG